MAGNKGRDGLRAGHSGDLDKVTPTGSDPRQSEGGSASPAMAHGSMLRHNRVLELLLGHAPLADILAELTRLIEMERPDTLASVLLLSEDRRHVLKGAAPSLPDFYNDAIHGAEIGPAAGSCGTAAYTGRRVVVSDIHTHPYWTDYRPLAEQAGLRACWSEPILGSTGQVLGTFAMYYRTVREPSDEDIALITETARLAGVAIERSRALQFERLTSVIFRQLPHGLMITDARFGILFVNAAFVRITGFDRDQVVGRMPEVLGPSVLGADRIREMLADSRSEYHFEVDAVRSDGQPYAAEISVTAQHDAGGAIEHWIVLLSDISERKASEALIHFQANYDVLTALPNRNLFQERLSWNLQRAGREREKVGLMLMDLDYFKEVNDSLGHDRGDELLINVAQRIRARLRETDTLARLGGDEFALIIPGVANPRALEQVASDVLGALSRPFPLAGAREVYISGSIGIAVYPEDGTDNSQLLRSADQAMYAAKHAGRNRFSRFTPKIRKAARDQARLLDDLKVALSESRLILHYQPVLRLDNGRVARVEALLRWPRSPGQTLHPKDFLAAAEKGGLIHEIGQWVRREVCLQAIAWSGQQLPVGISFNVSPMEFLAEGLDRSLVAVLKETGVGPGKLTLEVTEALLMKPQPEVRRILERLRAAGIRIAIDDFGRDWTSLSMLTRFPVDELKIDLSLVQALGQDPGKQALVDTMIDLAHRLDIVVTAEGVESDAHRQLLRDRHCDLAQGTAMAGPMTADALAEALKGGELRLEGAE